MGGHCIHSEVQTHKNGNASLRCFILVYEARTSQLISAQILNKPTSPYKSRKSPSCLLPCKALQGAWPMPARFIRLLGSIMYGVPCLGCTGCQFFRFLVAPRVFQGSAQTRATYSPRCALSGVASFCRDPRMPRYQHHEDHSITSTQHREHDEKVGGCPVHCRSVRPFLQTHRRNAPRHSRVERTVGSAWGTLRPYGSIPLPGLSTLRLIPASTHPGAAPSGPGHDVLCRWLRGPQSRHDGSAMVSFAV